MEGNIYRIICRKTGKQYIGYTTKTIDSRLYHHEQKYDIFKKTGISRENYSSFEVLEENDYYIELIETISPLLTLHISTNSSTTDVSESSTAGLYSIDVRVRSI